jgi:hypothetical protein
MRLRATLPFALVLVLVAALSTAPGLLAQQGGTPTPTLDPAPTPNFEDIFVTCGGRPCEDVEGELQQTYDVEFRPHAYVPELTYEEAMVVMVVEGSLAFRVQSNDVIVDPRGNGGDLASDQITLLKTTDNEGDPVTVPFGQSPSTVAPDQQPKYNDNGTMSDADCSRDPAGPLQDLCLLNPMLFADEMTFVKLEPGDITYLPAGSTCFFCNVTDAGVTPAKVEVWAPGKDFSWYDESQNSNATTAATPSAQAQGLHDFRSWILNPGSSCN